MNKCARYLTLAIGISLAAPAAAQPASNDGSHGFDGEFGNWTLHIRRLLHPLSHASDWVTYDGTKVDTPLWGGKANVAEVNADGSAGHLSFIALRLFNQQSHQWSLNFASANSGAFDTPLFGEFHDGAIEFIGPDTFEGRRILVRFVSHEDSANHATSEQYFSDDGGDTWELNWVNDYTRAKG